MKLVPTLQPSNISAGNWHLLSWLKADLERAIKESGNPVRHIRPTNYNLDPTPEEAAAILDPDDSRPLVLDIETIITTDRITHCGVSRQACTAICMPWRPPFTDLLRRALSSPSSLKIAHNSMFDFPRLAKALGISSPAGPWFDTLIAHSLVEPDHPHRLESVAVAYYDQTPWKDGKTESLELYNCRDVDATFRCYEGLTRDMMAIGVTKAFSTLSMPNVPLAIEMSELGIRLDEARVEAVRQELTDELKISEQFIQDFYINSNQRKALVRVMRGELEVLHQEIERLDAPGTKREANKLRTKARKLEKEMNADLKLNSPSKMREFIRSLSPKLSGLTASDENALLNAMRRVPELAPFLKGLLKYRELSKGISTYLSYDTDHLHPRWLLWGTPTGRYSCREPNIQNIPKRRDWAWKIRSCFVPPIPGWEFTELDYSQLERRIQAIIWNDIALKDAYAKGLDTHTNTASLMFGVPPDQVTKQQRYFAKRVVYGDSYGMGPIKLAQEFAKEGIPLPVSEAKNLLARLRIAHPGVAEGQRKTLELVAKQRYLRNRFGRIRHFLSPQTHGDALNFEPQCTAACIMLRVAPQVREAIVPALIVAQIHDALLFCHPPGMGHELVAKAQPIMEQAIEELDGYKFPTDATIGGKTWAFR